MYCQKRGDKYRFYESYRDPKTKLWKTVSITMDRDTQKTRKQASDALNARIRRIKGQGGQYAAVTLSALCDAYIEYQRAHVSPQTVIGDEKALKAIKALFGADTDINEIDARTITATLDKSGESNTRKNYRLKHLKKLLRWAYQYDYIKDGAFLSKVKKYKDDEKGRRKFKYLEREEIAPLLADMKIDKYRVLTEFLILTGLRIGEALALTPNDIDRGNRTITVNKALSLVTYDIGTPKTEESNRVIHIQNELLPVIDKIPPECFKNIQYPAYTKYIKAATLRTTGRELTPHALRHTHVSLLAAAGVPLDLISTRCGHADSGVTRAIYLHVTNAMKDRDAAILDAIKIT